jgi:DNA-binding HxlR family transcriptional regulator
METAEPLADVSRMCGTTPADSAPIRAILDRVGDKWSLLIIGTLEPRALRFTALQRAIPGISHRMLARTLRSLERDGLVSRTSYPEIPPRVEYEVTDLGRTLIPPTVGLIRWAFDHNDELERNRTAFDLGGTRDDQFPVV